MTRTAQKCSCALLIAANLTLVGCQLHRPATTPSRTLEPPVLEPQLAEQPVIVAKSPNALSIRLLATESRGDIGRRVLHRHPDGELIEDPVWRWSTPPARYLDTALHSEVASSSKLRLVAASDAPALAAYLLAWNLESSGGTRLVGAVEFEMTDADRVIHTQMVHGSEAVSAELPGDLAAAAGRLMHRLASEGLNIIESER